MIPTLSNLPHFSDPSLLILLSLASGERHGYAMIEDILSFSGIKLGPGTLYGAIARLTQRGLIEPLPTTDRRQPYRLTEAGVILLKEQLAELNNFVTTGLQRLATL